MKLETQIPESLYNQVKSLAERESITVDHSYQRCRWALRASYVVRLIGDPKRFQCKLFGLF